MPKSELVYHPLPPDRAQAQPLLGLGPGPTTRFEDCPALRSGVGRRENLEGRVCGQMWFSPMPAMVVAGPITSQAGLEPVRPIPLPVAPFETCVTPPVLLCRKPANFAPEVHLLRRKSVITEAELVQ